MNTTETCASDEFLRAFTAPELAVDIDKADDIYGWLIGSWSLEVRHYRGVDLGGQGLMAEAHFARVLEGRAIGDVWLMPARGSQASREAGMTMYGMTLRSWDPQLGAWRIAWNNPAGGHREMQIGRRVGGDIVQTGARPDGQATRWRFTEIAPERFHWIGEALDPDGETWRIEGEFIARRVGR